MKQVALLIIVCLLFNFAVAGDKLLTLEDAILGGRRNLGVANLQGLKWIREARA